MADIELAKKDDLDEIEQNVTENSSTLTTLNSEVDTISATVKKKSDEGHTHDYGEIENTPTIPSTDDLATKEEVQTIRESIPSIDNLATKEMVDLKADNEEVTTLKETINTLSETVASLTDRITELEKDDEPEPDEGEDDSE